MNSVINDIFRRLAPEDLKTLLDVGCGSTGYALEVFPAAKILGIDVDDHGVKCSLRKGLKAVKYDMRNMSGMFMDNSFDLVFFKDSLEHISKSDAVGVLIQAKRIAIKAIIVYMPLGAVGDNPWDKGPHKHRHHWQVKELVDLGFEVELVRDIHGSGKHGMVGKWAKIVGSK